MANEKNLKLVEGYSEKRKALETVDEKFKVGEVMNHLHKMMKDVTEKDVTSENVKAACDCVSKMNETINVSLNVAKFLSENSNA